MAQWVIDTCALYHASSLGRHGADTPTSEQAATALALLAHIATALGHQIAEDLKGRVAAEYGRCWKAIARDRQGYPSKDAAHSFWYALWGRPHLQVERPLPNALRQLLLAKNMKEDGDIAFVEAAAGTASRLLTTEDHDDYSAEVRAEISTRIDVTVLDYRESLDRARGARAVNARSR